MLLSSDPREPRCRQVLTDLLGSADATDLVRWLWERHHAGSAPTFGDALAAVTEQTERNGLQFARNLLDVARKPKHVSEAECDVMAWVIPRIEEAAVTVQGHRGNPEVAREEFAALCWQLEEKLRRMFPDAHRASLRGAVVSSFVHQGGAFSLDVAALVRALHLPDPLAVTAKASWMAT